MEYSKEFIEKVKEVFGEGEILELAEMGYEYLGRVLNEAISTFPSEYILTGVELEGVNFYNTLKVRLSREDRKAKVYSMWLEEVREPVTKNENTDKVNYSAKFMQEVLFAYGEDSDVYKLVKNGDFFAGRLLDKARVNWPLSSMINIIQHKTPEEALDELCRMAENENAKKQVYEMWTKEHAKEMQKHLENIEIPSHSEDFKKLVGKKPAQPGDEE